MLSTIPNSKAASIWSFDSGYGSAIFEDDEGIPINQLGSSSIHETILPFRQERGHLDLGNSLSPDVENGLRLRDITKSTEPHDTILDVFTAKVCSSNESLSAKQDDDQDCLRCQLWNITNPGEDLRCEDCASEALLAYEAVIRIEEQSKTATTVPRRNTIGESPSQTLSQPEGTSRCSACKISVLIDPEQSSRCASCAPNTKISSRSPVSHASRVKRSCARRPPTKLESHATRCLQGWLKENQHDPYPDADTKRSLAEKCGITEKQVNTWFTNARARRRVVDSSLSNPASEIEGSQETRLWSAGPTAVSNGESCDRRGSVASYCLTEGPNQTGAVTSRRGKKKDYGQSSINRCVAHQAPLVPSASVSICKKDDGSETQTWQCTFCYQHITRKSWRRHEETQHRPKRKWTCLVSGPSITLPCRSGSAVFCVFCMVSNPSDLHFAQCHRIAECISKDEDERTFLRPDHLRQHVKNFHKERLNETIRDLWRREGPSSNAVENWVCGFCAKELKTWQDRQTHIAGHFKDGLTMTDWKGYMRQDTEAEASKKRPTSSEGRPNMLSKLARTLTGRSVHQQLHCMSRNQIADVFDTTQPFTGTRCPDLRLLPELIFDDFMLGGDDGYLDYSDMTLTSAYEQDSVSAERHDSAFPDGVNAGFNFGNLVEGSTNEDSSSLNTFGLWNE